MAEPTDPVRHEPSLFASTIKEPAPRSGVSIWLAAAAALVIGIGIGFASGYRAGKGATSVAATATENPAATSGAAAGQPFSESSVQEPVKLNPEPIVPAPETAQPGPPRGIPPAAASAPQRSEKPVPAPAGPAAPPRRIERAGEPARRSQEQGLKPAPVEIPPAGPASVQVVSRPSGAQVIFDGRVIGKTPLTIGDVATGFHDIRLELSGFKGWSTTVGVKAGIATRVAASLEQ